MFDYFISILNPVITITGIHNTFIPILIMLTTVPILYILVKFNGFFSSNYILFSLFNLPGTILHELMHFLVGIILFAGPRGFSLLPKRVGDSITMGSVSFIGLGLLNRIPVAMAPLLLMPLSLFLMDFFSNILLQMPINVSTFLMAAFFGYMIYVTLISSIPSITDFKVAFGSLLFIPIILGIFYFFLKDSELFKSILNLIIK